MVFLWFRDFRKRSLAQALKKAGLPPMTERPGSPASLRELSARYLDLLILGIDHRRVGTPQWVMIIEGGADRVQEVLNG